MIRAWGARHFNVRTAFKVKMKKMNTPTREATLTRYALFPFSVAL